MMSRTPAVAGMFYPGDPQTLSKSVITYLNDAAGNEEGGVAAAPKALIVPHAGFQYSAPIAASAYRLLQRAQVSIERVVLLGPAHRVYLEGMAVPDASAFDFPGGSIPLDVRALEQIQSFPGVCVSNQAHAQEHCLEVQLPFLRAVLDDFLLVPLVVGACASQQVAAVLEYLWGGDETLIVVSSDLSHYLPYDDARDIDQRTSAAIAERSTSLDGHQACGAYAINGLMAVASRTDMQVEILDVRNSGDTAGDRSRVVGYGAYALY